MLSTARFVVTLVFIAVAVGGIIVPERLVGLGMATVGIVGAAVAGWPVWKEIFSFKK